MKNEESRLRKFEVYIGNKHYTTVYFHEDMTANEVRSRLINHDGAPTTISVYKVHAERFCYSDMARANHPEELQ